MSSTASAREPRLQVAHTADLGAAALGQVRALLEAAFVDDPLDEHDWDHALGGLHAVLWSGDAPVAHASLVQRRIMHGGRALRAGYVEAVGVHPDWRRAGHGGAVMAPLERAIASAYDVGALAASEQGMPFYLGRGWQRWEGSTSALTPHGVVHTPDCDDCVLVLPVGATVDRGGELTCDWREGAPW